MTLTRLVSSSSSAFRVLASEVAVISTLIKIIYNRTSNSPRRLRGETLRIYACLLAHGFMAVVGNYRHRYHRLLSHLTEPTLACATATLATRMTLHAATWALAPHLASRWRTRTNTPGSAAVRE